MGTLPLSPADPLAEGAILDTITPVTPEEVCKIIKSVADKTSANDFISTSIIKSCSGVFSEIIAHLANLSFTQVTFPSRFKTALVIPRLKKDGLERENPANYRPISNLNNISKILERLFLTRFQPHITSSPHFNPHQSAYRRHHSTETALLLNLDHIYHASDNGEATLLLSLDLSAAFDTIDHDILLSRLHSMFNVSGTTLKWLQSYLTSRSFFVKVAKSSSKTTPCSCGVPQGLILGPLLFTAYASTIANIALSHNISQQQYADDTQLYISISKPTSSLRISHLELCLNDLCSWFTSNGLALNPDKSEAILFGTRQRCSSMADVSSVNVSKTSVALQDHIKLLGVTLDSNLTFNQHVTSVTKSCYYHIRSFRHIRPNLTTDMAKTVAVSLVGSRLDYANSVLVGTSTSNINRLQRVQNTIARVVTLQKKHDHVSQTLRDLHWLPVKQRIDFKLATITFKTQNSAAPGYLSSLVSNYTPTRTLRSSSQNFLTAPRVKTVFGSRGFRVAAPTVWNSLPDFLTSSNNIETFKRRLKTFYFTSVFTV